MDIAMDTNAPSLLSQWIDWSTLAANIVTVIGFILGGWGAFVASRKFFAGRRYDQLAHVYGLANDLWRAGLTIQKRKRENKPIGEKEREALYAAKNALTNWYYDNRFLFASDRDFGRLMKEIDDEADEIIEHQRMDDLKRLIEFLESKLKKAP